MPFIPHTKDNIQTMLDAIGISTMDDVFREIPKSLRYESFKDIPAGMNEMNAAKFFGALSRQDEVRLNFAGAGAYEHYIPAAVWDITTRGEFMTAYTPYQAEASQGTLQAIYEYQTMMSNLMGMEVSNASLYDGASATAEAVLMALRCNRKSKSHKVLCAGTLHPHYRDVVKTIVGFQGIEIVTLDYDRKQGLTDLDTLAQFEGQDFGAVIIPQPTFFGTIGDTDVITNWAHANNTYVIAVVNPVAMAVITPPGQWGEKGADIVVGEGQPLGVPMASGGPYYGFMCARQKDVRQMPGRIVGRSVDLDGNIAYTLTLQAREQHIRRAKATSNICTNQGLAVTASTIYMALMGPEGLTRVANNSHALTLTLRDALSKLEGVRAPFSAPVFHEFVIELPIDSKLVLDEMAKRGIQGGYDISDYYEHLNNAILICVTETKSTQDCEEYVSVLQTILQEHAHTSAAIEVA